MLWSSFYPDEINRIPNVGCLVTYGDRLHPYTVEKRIVSKGNVLLDLCSDNHTVERERLEVLNWYPEVGDLCEMKLKPYVKWRSLYNDFEIPRWLWKPSRLIEVKGDRAIVLPTGKSEEKRMVPFEGLIVVEKFDMVIPISNLG